MSVSLSLVGLAFSMEGPKGMLKHAMIGSFLWSQVRRYEAVLFPTAASHVKYAKDKVQRV